MKKKRFWPSLKKNSKKSGRSSQEPFLSDRSLYLKVVSSALYSLKLLRIGYLVVELLSYPIFPFFLDPFFSGDFGLYGGVIVCGI